MDRRQFLKAGLVASAAAVSFSNTIWQRAAADHPPLRKDVGPYGPLGQQDANGIRLPAGFTSRVIARAGQLVEGTAYIWHLFPDGGATFAADDGGWIYVSNSEAPLGGLPGAGGGAGAVRFDANGRIVDAYRILHGTATNCAGGATPWGTWLSCEEHEAGQVWECDPTGQTDAVARPAMGVFTHEAAAVDPVGRHVYMTEDRSDGRFYRFTPASYPDLSAGLLEVAIVADDTSVTWAPVPNPTPIPFVQRATRAQVPESTAFRGGEGCWFDDVQRIVYFATKGDNRIWEYHVDQARMTLLHDPQVFEVSPLDGPDNVTVARSGDLYICEDGGNLEIVMITPDGIVAPFLHVVGQSSTEIAGAAFDPSGTRLYFSSQRGSRLGITYEVTGPFRMTA